MMFKHSVMLTLFPVPVELATNKLPVAANADAVKQNRRQRLLKIRLNMVVFLDE